MPKVIAAIDQGTTSTRCMLFNHSGQAIGAAQQPHEQHFPQPGWVEHNPLEIWRRTQEVIQGAVENAHIQYTDIQAIGITNQRETTLAWNPKTGQPYANAIVWQDTRTKPICDQLAKTHGHETFRNRTGLPLATYFSGPKLIWMLDHIDGLRTSSDRGEVFFGNIDSWLIWWLTGGPGRGIHVTDVTNASRTLLMNLSTLDWDADILSELHIPSQILPRILSSSDPNNFGFSHQNGPFNANIPICGDLGDQQAALVGQTCFEVGEAKNTYGTGCFMLLNTGQQIKFSKNGLLTTLAYKFGDQPAAFALEGSIAIGGALVQWLRDNLGLINQSDEIETLARSSENNGGVYIVPAFSGLFAPYWRSDARGVIVGLTRFSNKGHLARAALEATAFQTLDVLDAMEKDSGIRLKSLKVDGGMVCNDLLMQFQADMLQVPVVRPKIIETTSLGAAYAAGLASGFWQDKLDLQANWQAEYTWNPEMEHKKRDALYHEWKRAVQRTFNWIENDG